MAATPTDPNYSYLGSNTVFVPMKNGTLQQTALDTGLHPWQNQVRVAPGLWTVDASLFKAIPITERFKLRLNADFFNVLNAPGTPLHNADTGIVSLQNSGQQARQLQLTLRLLW